MFNPQNEHIFGKLIHVCAYLYGHFMFRFFRQNRFIRCIVDLG